MGTYTNLIRQHYESIWESRGTPVAWTRGPRRELPEDFSVLVFPPARRKCWIYATCGLSQPREANRIELFLLSPVESNEHIELLTAIAHYHRTGAPLGVGHTINFGRPWIAGSKCDHGLVSLPYLDGPRLEYHTVQGESVRFLWLVPITESEVTFAKQHGLNALEERFEKASFNYLDPTRRAVA